MALLATTAIAILLLDDLDPALLFVIATQHNISCWLSNNCSRLAQSMQQFSSKQNSVACVGSMVCVCVCVFQIKAQLAAAEGEMSSLRSEAERVQTLAGECEQLRSALEQAEEGRKAQSQEGRREQALLERQLQAAGRDRDQLAEQVLPHAVCVCTSA